MRVRRFALALLGVALAALSAPLPLPAKEGVKATLTTSVPLEASAGTRLTMGWRLFSVGEHGQREPFGANGVFVRLLSASGEGAAEGVAPDGAYATGEYEATVIVPEGGIGGVEIGLRGWVSGPTGTRRSDLLFPITNDPLPRVGPRASAASRRPDSERSDTWVFVLTAGALFTLAVLAVGKRRSRCATYPPM
jgi:hypothetical protein